MTQNNDFEQENIFMLVIGVKSDTSWIVTKILSESLNLHLCDA